MANLFDRNVKRVIVLYFLRERSVESKLREGNSDQEFVGVIWISKIKRDKEFGNIRRGRRNRRKNPRRV